MGPALTSWLAPMLEWLPVREEVSERPTLYACENDHMAVQDLARSLEGRVVVIPCLVGPDGHFLPRHGEPFDSRDEGSKCIG